MKQKLFSGDSLSSCHQIYQSTCICIITPLIEIHFKCPYLGSITQLDSGYHSLSPFQRFCTSMCSVYFAPSVDHSLRCKNKKSSQNPLSPFLCHFSAYLHSKVSFKNVHKQDFPCGPVIKNLPFKAGDVSSIPGQGTKIPHTSEPHVPQPQSLCASNESSYETQRRSPVKILCAATKTQQLTLMLTLTQPK